MLGKMSYYCTRGQRNIALSLYMKRKNNGSRLERVKGEIKMADVKKAATAKPVAKAVAAAKPVEAAPAKAEAKAAPAKEVTTKKAAPVKKAPVKKEAEEKKAAPEKKAEVKAVVNLQFSGRSYTTEDLVKIAKDVWKYDLKKKVSDFKTVELYVKPEESQVYYVINEEVTGSFGI